MNSPHITAEFAAIRRADLVADAAQARLVRASRAAAAPRPRPRHGVTDPIGPSRSHAAINPCSASAGVTRRNRHAGLPAAALAGQAGECR